MKNMLPVHLDQSQWEKKKEHCLFKRACHSHNIAGNKGDIKHTGTHTLANINATSYNIPSWNLIHGGVELILYQHLPDQQM